MMPPSYRRAGDPAERRRHKRKHWQRVRTGWRDTWRDLLYPIGLLDEKGNPSATKMLAVLAGIAATHGRFVDDKPLTMHDDYWITLAVFGALGKAGLEMWKEYRTRQQTVDATQDASDAADRHEEARIAPHEEIAVVEKPSVVEKIVRTVESHL